MTPRPATTGDIPQLVAIHAQAWRETYPGLLPDSEIERMTGPDRLTAVWTAILARPDVRAAILPEAGFATMGRQRDPGLREAGYPEELWAIYLLQSAQGTGFGRALLAFVAGATAFTALVVECNARASRFYEQSGGRIIGRRPDRIGETDIVELVFAWGDGGLQWNAGQQP
ncbi:MAG: GNAT family N-acetyltransferase [Rhodobacterales bacterium]|jgi:GNAT superfamily N-acetyltransferase|nr:GNAT family N-acetyltransferase [Rhodobacter sp.]